ncbi:response regulator transcription factor [Actinoplanes sp. RD1]|uniref:response regulator transcription factor n=1 Tax=Actinoplanes sp. RD1 TaxID=3064538 RepID=UPI0027424B39|nr:response regulator transcription factor [Actinoplanes sp. RD1]
MELWAVVADPLAQRGMRQLAGELDNVRTCVVVDSAAAVTGSPDVVVLVGQSPTAMSVLAGRFATVAMVPDAAPEQVRAAWRAGVRAVVSTSAGTDEVRMALRVARAGGGYLCRRLSAGLRTEHATATPGTVLNRRERETLDFIAQGLTHAQTARLLGVSEATVHSYVTRLRGKLTAGNTADLTRRALTMRLTHPSPSLR